MKNNMVKKLLTLALAGAMTLSLAACGSKSDDSSNDAQQGGDESGKTYKVAIIKQLDHASLDEIANAVAAELDKIAADNNVTIEYDITSGQNDQTILKQLSDQAIADQVDAIIPIATTAAQISALSAEDTKTPVVYAAVSDPEAARLTGIDLSLADYCITLTLTQLPNVNAVSITADGRELPYRETQVLLSADTLLSSRESGLRPITVSLYFLDSKTGELRAEQQTLALYEGQTRVNALLEALAQGPEDDSLVSLLPEDFAVISSRIENGVCYLNLPASGSLPENEAERDLMLSALEQSILSLGGVDEVQFLIEGSAEPDGYR